MYFTYVFAGLYRKVSIIVFFICKRLFQINFLKFDVLTVGDDLGLDK